MNKDKSLSDKIKKEIKKKKLDAFTAKDFIELANIRTINKSLERMEKGKVIRRVISGVYDIPEYSSILSEYGSPSINAIAQALARANNWKICPSGTSALNYLGLSTQVPAQYIYVSSGPYKNYTVENVELIFKHTNNRLMFDSSDETAIIIQAIKAIGRGNVTDDHVGIIMAKYENEAISKRVLKESKQSSAWIYETIREMFGVN